MDKKVSRYLLLSQLSFFVCLGICLAIIPTFLFAHDQGGMSNYGVRLATVVPYTIGFLLCGVCIAEAASLTPRSPTTLLRYRRSLCTLAVLVFVVLASTYPYKIDTTLKYVHLVAGILLISFELALAVWLVLVLFSDWVNILALILQAVGCALALVTLIGVLHVLFVAQLVLSLGFGVVLVRTGYQMAELPVASTQ